MSDVIWRDESLSLKMAGKSEEVMYITDVSNNVQYSVPVNGTSITMCLHHKQGDDRDASIVMN